MKTDEKFVLLVKYGHAQCSHNTGPGMANLEDGVDALIQDNIKMIRLQH